MGAFANEYNHHLPRMANDYLRECVFLNSHIQIRVLELGMNSVLREIGLRDVSAELYEVKYVK